MPCSERDLEDYYRTLYPVEAVAWLVNGPDAPLAQREFAAEGAYYKRYISARSASELRAALLQVPGLKAPQIGPVYSGAVTRTGFQGGELAPEQYSRPHRRELIFDVDLTDYEFLDLSGPTAGDPTGLNLEACDRAWPVAGLAVFFLKYLLREHLGFCEFLVVYSGRRGVHLWVLDDAALLLSDEARGAIASFVNFAPDKSKTRASSSMRQFCQTYDVLDAVWDAFESILVEGMGLLDDVGARESFVERLALAGEGLEHLADEAGRKSDGVAAWKYIKTKVFDAAKRHSKRGWFVERLQEVVIAYVWPRIDFNVTKAVNHLIKSPLVAHPKTGRIAVPVPRDEVLTFDPSCVPKLGDADLAERLASRSCSLQLARSREPPLNAVALPRRGKQRAAKGSRRRQQQQQQAPADAPPPLVDVEDVVFPMDEVEGPRPREVDRLRHPGLRFEDPRRRAFVPNRSSPLAEGGSARG